MLEEPVLENPTTITFILKGMAKKDSTELMLKALITRTQTPKPVRHHLKPAETATECFLQYETIELLKEAESKITGEKINGAPFLVEILQQISQKMQLNLLPTCLNRILRGHNRG